MQFAVVCCSELQRTLPGAEKSGLGSFDTMCMRVSCSGVQCHAVCCSVLQCVAVCCGVLQCTSVCCSVLQLVAVYSTRGGEVRH